MSLGKKTSTVMSNLDSNTYRAMKLAIKDNHTERKQRCISLLSNLRKKNDLMKYPFCLKDERFKWQTNKALNDPHYIDLSKTLSYVKKPLASTKWDGFSIITKYNERDHFKKKLDYSNSARTINPKLNDEYEKIQSIRVKSIDYDLKHDSSICSLMEKSSIVKIKKYTNYNKRSKSSVFEEYNIPVSGKKRTLSVENLNENSAINNQLNNDEIKSFHLHKKQHESFIGIKKFTPAKQNIINGSYSQKYVDKKKINQKSQTSTQFESKTRLMNRK